MVDLVGQGVLYRVVGDGAYDTRVSVMAQEAAVVTVILAPSVVSLALQLRVPPSLPPSLYAM